MDPIDEVNDQTTAAIIPLDALCDKYLPTAA
jgi:hypothetical protein